MTVSATREGERAVLEVEDNGPGIPPGERERVFDRFYRGESVAEGGSGLGLAIVRRIAERHGGHVALLDARGGGDCGCASSSPPRERAAVLSSA